MHFVDRYFSTGGTVPTREKWRSDGWDSGLENQNLHGIILKYTNPSFVKEERYVYYFGTTVE